MVKRKLVAAKEDNLSIGSLRRHSQQPYTRNGYRYLPAAPHPTVAHTYQEVFLHPYVALSMHDRSRALVVDADGLAACGGHMGYRSVRATHGTSTSAYFEVQICNVEQTSVNDPHLRFGWATLSAAVDGPIGMDRHGFGVCDRGDKVNNGEPQQYCKEALRAEDVIGCMIWFPSDAAVAGAGDGNVCAKRTPIRHYGIFLEEKIEDGALEHPTPVVGSAIRFYKNGASLGTAFADIPGGIYYPMLSCYRGGRARINFGPEFAYPPDVNIMPMSAEFVRYAAQTAHTNIYSGRSSALSPLEGTLPPDTVIST